MKKRNIMKVVHNAFVSIVATFYLVVAVAFSILCCWIFVEVGIEGIHLIILAGFAALIATVATAATFNSWRELT